MSTPPKTKNVTNQDYAALGTAFVVTTFLGLVLGMGLGVWIGVAQIAHDLRHPVPAHVGFRILNVHADGDSIYFTIIGDLADSSVVDSTGRAQ